MQFGRYTLERRLAVGGMAELFLAHIAGPDSFRKQIVIKRILPHLLENEGFVEMFVDEARLAARFDHPNLLRVFELAKIDGQYCFAMEYLIGKDLQQVTQAAVARGIQFPEAVVTHIVGCVARGLHYAHDLVDDEGAPLSVVHRDVSPGNVFITTHGEVKVVDFGIAQSADRMSPKTMTNVLKGKFTYMSPEQAEGKPLDRRSDIFSLGIVMYEMLSGERCFGNPQSVETLMDKVKGVKVTPIRNLRPDLSPAVEEILTKMMAISADGRYANAAEVERAVVRAQDDGATVHDIAEFVESVFAEEPPSGDATVITMQPTADNVRPVAVSGKWSDPSVGIDRKGLATILGSAPPGLEDSRQSGPGNLVKWGVVRLREVLGWPRSDTMRVHRPAQPGLAAAEGTGIIQRLRARPWLAAVGFGLYALVVVVGVVALIHYRAVVLGDDAEPLATSVIETSPTMAPPDPEPSAALPVVSVSNDAAPTDAVNETGSTPESDEADGLVTPVTPVVAAPAPRQRPRRKVGTLVIDSQPRTDVFLGRKKLGTTPVRAGNIPAGTVQIELRNTKLGISKSVRLTVPVGGTVKRKITVAKGTVRISVRPWAVIYLRGKKLGTTPMPPLSLYEGRHSLRLVNPDSGKERTVTVDVRAGKVTRVIETLQ